MARQKKVSTDKRFLAFINTIDHFIESLRDQAITDDEQGAVEVAALYAVCHRMLLDTKGDIEPAYDFLIEGVESWFEKIAPRDAEQIRELYAEFHVH